MELNMKEYLAIVVQNALINTAMLQELLGLF